MRGVASERETAAIFYNEAACNALLNSGANPFIDLNACAFVAKQPRRLRQQFVGGRAERALQANHSGFGDFFQRDLFDTARIFPAASLLSEATARRKEMRTRFTLGPNYISNQIG